MTHVPGVAVRHRDQRFREPLLPPHRIQVIFTQCESLPALGQGGKGLDIVAAREMFAVTHEDRRPECRVVVEVMVGLGQAVECLRVDAVEHLRTIDRDDHDLSAPLHRDLGVGR